MRLFAAILGSMLVTAPLYAQTAPAPATPGAPPAAGTQAQRTTPQQRRAEMEKRFDAANTTRDGKLTLAQAQAAKHTGLVKNFQAIDRGAKGYVTKDDIEAYMRSKKTQQSPL